MAGFLLLVIHYGNLGLHPTFYVRIAMFQLPMTDHLERESVGTKCPKCKEVTPQEFIKIEPVSDGREDIDDPMALLKMTKRLTLCTVCGNLRLID